jgi:hypothetical protein
MTSKTVNLSGGFVFWTLSGNTDHTIMSAGFSQLNLSRFCPEKNTEGGALKAALIKTFGGRNIDVKSIQRGKGYGVAQYDGTRVGDGRYAPLFDVMLPKGSTKIDFLSPETGEAIENEPANANEARKRFWRELDCIPLNKLASSLVRVVKHLGGIPLRDNGGVYWLPEDSLKVWDGLSLVLKHSSESNKTNKLYRVQTNIDPKGVEAIMDALTRTTLGELKTLEDDIKGGSIGKRAMESRREKASKLQDRVKRYATILGTTLTDLEDACDDTDQAAAMAILATFGA